METRKAANNANNAGNTTEKNLIRDIGAIYVVMFTLLMLLSSRMVHADMYQQDAQPAQPGQAEFPTLIAVGKGELTWFGLSIYKASLWTIDGNFTNVNDSIPVALTITYEKNINKNTLVDRTVEEWEYLGIFNTEKRSFWASQLSQIWPSVKPGDNITTLVNEDRKTRFYYNGKFLQELDDPVFGTALLSIWLNPGTSEPDLRAKLIGQQES